MRHACNCSGQLVGLIIIKAALCITVQVSGLCTRNVVDQKLV